MEERLRALAKRARRGATDIALPAAATSAASAAGTPAFVFVSTAPSSVPVAAATPQALPSASAAAAAVSAAAPPAIGIDAPAARQPIGALPTSGAALSAAFGGAALSSGRGGSLAAAAATAAAADAECEALIGLLVASIVSKKSYDAVFSTPEGAAATAVSLRLSEGQRRLLLAMQAQKDVYKHNTLLDAALTLAFAGVGALLARVLWRQGILVGFLIGLGIVHTVIHRIRDLSRPIAIWLGAAAVSRGLAASNPFSAPIQMKKWQDQFWQLVVHVVFSAAEFIILGSETWWTSPATCWDPTTPTRANLRLFYISQLAIWTYTGIMHRFFDERKRDYFVLYAHHVLTIALVLFSWAAGPMSMRIGLIVLYVHDVSDIAIDLLKLINFTKFEGLRGFFLSEIAYVVCVLSWIYFRMWEYPFRVIRGALVDAVLVRAPPLPAGYGDAGSIASNPMSIAVLALADPLSFVAWVGRLQVELQNPYWTCGVLFLVALFILHCYWLRLLLLVGWRMAVDGAREASRSEYEGDSDDEERSAKGSANTGNANSGLCASGAADGGSKFDAGGIAAPLLLVGKSGGTGRREQAAQEDFAASIGTSLLAPALQSFSAPLPTALIVTSIGASAFAPSDACGACDGASSPPVRMASSHAQHRPPPRMVASVSASGGGAGGMVVAAARRR